LQTGRTVLDGPADAMADNADVQRIYLGLEPVTGG
jgi:ABC-type branched-subunit amino acid transport system ATPase component